MSGRAGDIGLRSRPPRRRHERMNARPDELIEYGPVTLRRYREDDLEAVFRAVTDSADHRPRRGLAPGPVALVGMGYGQPDQLDREMMALALGQARVSMDAGGVPVGAVLVAGGQVLAAGHNERVQRGDPVAHGEIACLRNAGRRPSYADTTAYTTLSPCQMCSGAILLFQIPRVVVGEAETFEGDLGFLVARGVEIVLLGDEDCVAAMREFQRRHPDIWSEDIGGR